jgi:hypothetical protein
MFSKEELLLKYDGYSDDELFEVYSELENYSDEAKDALNKIILRRGGLERLLTDQKEKQIISAEIERINNEVQKFYAPDVDISFLKKLITSDILSADKLNQIIDIKYSELEKELEDKKIKPQTLSGSIIGGIIAGIIGGVLWGLQMIYSKRIFTILFLGLILLCYGIIKLSTKQSHKNKVVLIATIIATIIALLIGQLLYEIVGYNGI